MTAGLFVFPRLGRDFKCCFVFSGWWMCFINVIKNCLFAIKRRPTDVARSPMEVNLQCMRLCVQTICSRLRTKFSKVVKSCFPTPLHLPLPLAEVASNFKYSISFTMSSVSTPGRRSYDRSLIVSKLEATVNPFKNGNSLKISDGLFPCLALS